MKIPKPVRKEIARLSTCAKHAKVLREVWRRSARNEPWGHPWAEIVFFDGNELGRGEYF